MTARVLLKRIKAQNFKSFAGLDVKMGELDVVIGTNASGKSNLIELFRFLRDVVNEGLDGAVSRQSEIEYMRSRWLGGKNMTIELDLGLCERLEIPGIPELYTSRAEWKLALKAGKRSVSVAQDRWIFGVSARGGAGKDEQPSQDPLAGSITVENGSDRACFVDHPHSKQILDILNRYEAPQENGLFVRSKAARQLFPAVRQFFGGAGIHKFNPRIAKEPAPANADSGLSYDASGLESSLLRILADARQREKLNNLVSDLAPFVKLASADKRRSVRVLPSRMPFCLLSNGTVGMIAVVVALYFESRALTVIEDPDAGVHPSLMAKIVDMLKEASERKQVIVTTHNPQLVKYADLESLMLVTRNGRGESEVSRPSQDHNVREFLKNDVRIEELYVQDIMGG